MEHGLGFTHFLKNADGVATSVLMLMLLMSIGTWCLIFVKSLRTMWAKRYGKAFLEAFWAVPGLDVVAEYSPDRYHLDNPHVSLARSALIAIEQHRSSSDEPRASGRGDTIPLAEFLSQALGRAIARSKSGVEYGQTYLATVASSAPFVGLFGTVLGIYHALIAIGISGQGTLDKVAGPIGEALIMTAIGLAVAIPAAVAYNVFARTHRAMLVELDAFAHDLFTFLVTGCKPPLPKRAPNTAPKSSLARVAGRSPT
ncbi:MAG: Biopolymer transport protein ExbB [Rhodocyclaceae bacterium]|nr:Biopolymer transport protein ExbB [Rhodocyclaceae bacterium]